MDTFDGQWSQRQLTGPADASPADQFGSLQDTDVLEDGRAIEVGKGGADFTGCARLIPQQVKDSAPSGIRQRLEHSIVAYFFGNR
ncbi:hypothetical protein GCM10009813_27180 [Brevibacterium marinum]